MPGNAGGAKGPDFWCAFEDGEVVSTPAQANTASTILTAELVGTTRVR